MRTAAAAEDAPVEIVAYDPSWPARFQVEQVLLAELLSPWLVAPSVGKVRAVRPNPSLERTRNGKAPWPRSAFVYDAPRGQGALPLRAAQLKR